MNIILLPQAGMAIVKRGNGPIIPEQKVDSKAKFSWIRLTIGYLSVEN